MIALTATATEETKKTIIDVLRLTNVFEVTESPNKANITYVVNYMPNDSDVQDYFDWIVQEIKQGKLEKTIVYCQTIKQCSLIYATLKSMLGRSMYGKDDLKCPLLEMLHSCTPDDNKEAVLESFRREDGPILVLIATIAFGMGVDCKGVHRTIHFGPSKNVEAFIQETGRAGRDGKPSFSFLLYKGLMLNHVERDIKDYLKTKECRRKTLLKQFGIENITISGPLHTCCDNCAQRCHCNMAECSTYTFFGFADKNLDSSEQKKRKVSESQKTELRMALVKYHKSLVMELITKSAFGHVKTLMNLNTLLGFSELQIEQVIDNCETLFCLEDVMATVEIWDIRHAKKILDVLGQVFTDVIAIGEEMAYDAGGDSDDELEDNVLLGDWAALAEDEELLSLLTGNLSFSGMESTIQDDTHQDCSDVFP